MVTMGVLEVRVSGVVNCGGGVGCGGSGVVQEGVHPVG